MDLQPLQSILLPKMFKINQKILDISKYVRVSFIFNASESNSQSIELSILLSEFRPINTQPEISKLIKELLYFKYLEIPAIDTKFDEIFKDFKY
jgi:uncharacterized membrane protein